MKRTLYNIFAVTAAILLTGVTTSCNKYLDVLPLNEVVLENYWTEKKDVTSVMNSCYESLENRESILRMEVWGELRSENIVQGSTPSLSNWNVWNSIVDALKETLLPSSTLTSWAIFYQTINRCNTVIHYAPGVQEIDPNYTYAELQSTIAEATFIRDLCYFYLLRTFGEVPITFEPSISDETEFEIEPTVGFKYVNGGWVIGPALDILINDLKGVENFAARRYIDDSEMENSVASSMAAANSSRVTRNAIYALLAELNLWKGDYDEAIRYCDIVLDAKKQQYEDKKDKLGEINDMMLFNEIPLIRECVEGGTTCGNAYNEIFGEGNSFESIFELEYYTNQGTGNETVGRFYGTSSTPLGGFATTDENSKDVELGNNDVWEKKKDDCRVYAIMKKENGRNSITKYVANSVSMTNRLNTISDANGVKLSLSRRNNEYANWIIYRLTDIVLMKAEALVMKGEAYYQEAFDLVDAVNCRARNITTGMFEGKRWYDLVRYSIHTGSNTFLAEQVTTKYQINGNAIKIRLSDPNSLFWPFNKDELKLNRYLKQNPAYGDTEDFKQ